MTRFVGFAWSIGGSDGVGASAFESKSIYSSNRNREPESFFSIFDTYKAITCMETVPPNMAAVFCTLYFSNQLSKCVTYLSRTFIKYSGHYTPF
jgi:hypothetical protein